MYVVYNKDHIYYLLHESKILIFAYVYDQRVYSHIGLFLIIWRPSYRFDNFYLKRIEKNPTLFMVIDN